MASDAIVVRTKPSFIRLIYSFALEPSEGNGGATVQRPPATAVLSHLKRRASECGWEDRRILHDYVLPQLSHYMNVQDARDREAEVGHWWRFAGTLPSRWRLRISAARTVELKLEGVELVFFRTGIGLLLLEVDPVSERLEDWQDVLHLSRFYRFPGADGGTSSIEHHGRRVFARRAAHLTAFTDDIGDESWKLQLESEQPVGFGLLIDRLMTDLFCDRTWERASVPGLLSPFSAFFVDWPKADERLRLEAVYRWRRQLRSSATVAATDHQDLHAEMQLYAENVWLAYSSEGGGLFAGDAPKVHFFEHELPDHLRQPYNFGYLLALHQRLALSRFSERIARVVATSRAQWVSVGPSRDQIAVLQDDFLEYLTRCHSAQVFRTTNHHANYKAWEEALDVPTFAEEVELQLRHLYERAVIAEQIINDRRRRALSGRVNAAVLGITLPTVVLAILAVAYPSGLRLTLTIALTVSSAVLGTAIGWLTATYVPGLGSGPRRRTHHAT